MICCEFIYLVSMAYTYTKELPCMPSNLSFGVNLLSSDAMQFTALSTDNWSPTTPVLLKTVLPDVVCWGT